MRKLTTLSLIVASSVAALSAQDATNLFESENEADYYYDFIEEAEPSEVFEIGAGGTLTIKGADQPEGYLQTLDEYENFELSFDWRWPKEAGDSGVMIHCTSDTSFGIWPEGIEIQINEEDTGDFWLFNSEMTVEEERVPYKASERNRRLKLKEKKPLTSAEKKKEEKKIGEWNSMRIVAKDDTIEVFLNGKKVNEATEVSPAAGYISFKSEESNIEFRNVLLKEL